VLVACFVLAGATTVRSGSDLVAHREASHPGVATAAGPLDDDPCGDRSFAENGGHWGATFRWSFRAISTPSGIKKRAAARALVRAAHNIVGARNDCGLADHVGAAQHYLGRTKARTGIEDDSTCGDPDGRNVVGFGTLSPEDMAVTCWWTQDGKTIEADVKFNKANYRWVTKVPSDCLLAWSVEAVATHEFGHAFGLDHVDEAQHGALTMSPLIAPCQSQESTLGLGDIRGLRAEY
jgi:hypothetical protein